MGGDEENIASTHCKTVEQQNLNVLVRNPEVPTD